MLKAFQAAITFYLTLSLLTFNAILISKSWFKLNLSCTSFSPTGFVLLRNDCTGKGGGGNAIYLRNDVPFKMLLFFSLSIL